MGHVKGSFSVGGFVGSNDGIINTSFSTSTVISRFSAGGFVGWNFGDIKNSFSTGNVTGSTTAGGFVSWNSENSRISECYSTGDVLNGELVGGFIGDNDGTVRNSYSIGKVTKTQDVGGFLGVSSMSDDEQANGLLIECVYDIESSQTTNGVGYAVKPQDITGLTTSEMISNTSKNILGDSFVIQSQPISNDIHELEVTYYPELKVFIESDNDVFVKESKKSVSIYSDTTLQDNEEIFVDGEGTKESPFEISNAKQLNHIREHLDAYFVLTEDIDLTDLLENTPNGWVPIGTEDAPFTGTLDGDNHKVTGLWIEQSKNNDIGFFGYANNATILNLSIVTHDNGITGNELVGGLVGRLEEGLIDNCTFTGTIKGVSSVGGLVGINEGQISGSYSTGSVEGESYVGGLVGNNGGPISGSYSTGSVTGKYTVGGAVGYNWDEISDCYSTGSVVGEDVLGGFIGDNHDKIFTSYTTSKVEGTYASAGGFVGENYGEISECFASNDVQGNSSVGGFVGYNPDTISNSFSSGKVLGQYEVGGFAGHHDGIIENSFSTSKVVGDNEVGGFAGESTNNSSLTNIYAAGSVELNESSDSSYIGGISGNDSIPNTVISVFFDKESTNQTHPFGNSTGDTSLGVTTSSLISAGVLTKDGVMGSFDSSNWTKRDSDDTVFYYPELKAFSSGIHETQSKNAVAVSQRDVVVNEISSTDLTYGQTLSDSTLSGKVYDSVSNLDVEGTFEWINPGEVYDTGKVEALAVFTPNDDFYKTVKDIKVELTVNKAAGAKVNKPSASETTASSITVNEGALESQTGQSIEYAIGTNSTTPGTWQSSTQFTGLQEWTEYYIFARSVSNSNYETGAVSVSDGIRTLDNTPPSGTISTKQSVWNTFINSITFGIFGKNTLQVTLSATDNESGIKSVEYVISESELSESDLKALTNMTSISSGGSFTISPNFKGVVYARITDNGDNVTVINSDGLVVYVDSQQTASASFTKDQSNDLRVAVEMNGNTVKQIVNNSDSSALLDSTQVIVGTDTITFTNAYLKTLSVGTHTFEVSYYPLGVNTTPSEGSDTPSNTTITLTINQIPTNLNLSDGSIEKTYGDATFDLNTLLSGNTGTGALTWRSSHPSIVSVDANGVVTIHGATNTTDVTLTVTQASDAEYTQGTASATITVNRKNATVNVDDQSMLYGETLPILTYNVEGLVGNDTLQGSLKVTDTSVGTHDIVEDASFTNDNYTVTFNKGTMVIGDNAPTGSITIKNSLWDSFLNTITFGLFGKNSLTVTITASDKEPNSVPTLEYVVSESELSESDLRALTQMTSISSGESFTISPNFKGVVYARITDNAGNVTVISSNGLVVYVDSQQTASASFTKDQSNDLSVAVAMNGNTVKQIVNNSDSSALLDSTQVIVGTDTITFTNAYLKTLSVGTHTFDVSYYPLGVDTTPSTGSDTPSKTTITLTINKIQTNLNLSDGSIEKTYGDATFDLNTLLSGNTGTGALTWRSSHPSIVSVDTNGLVTIHGATNTTDVTLTVTQASDAEYTEGTASATITVNRKNATVNVDDQSMLYGETLPILTYNVEGLVGNDTLQGSLKVTDTSVGTHDIVEDASFTNDNYTVTFNKGTMVIGDNAPTGSITIKNSLWDSFLNTITFGLFGKNSLTVTITASDKEPNSVPTLEYVVSESELIESDLRALTQMTSISSGGSFTITPNFKGVVYARITDNAGNVTVINSDGLVVYVDSQQTASASFTKDQSNDLSLTVDMNGNTVKQIVNNSDSSALLDTTQVRVGSNAITFTNAYLKTLSVGTHTFDVSYYPLGVTTTPSTGSDTPSNTTITLTINKIQTNLNLSDGSIEKTYGDATFDLNTLLSGNTGTGALTWRSSHPSIVSVDANGVVTIHGATNTTDVTLTVTQASDAEYTQGTASATITVNRKNATVTADDQSMTFGETLPTLTFKVSGLVGNDTLQGSLKVNGTSVGTHDIVEDGPFTNDNYTVTFTKGSMVIEKTKELETVISSVEKVVRSMPLPELEMERHDAVSFADAVAETVNAFNALSEEEKAQLPDEVKEQLVEAQVQAGIINHTTEQATVEGLNWDIRLVVEELSQQATDFESIRESIEAYDVLYLFDIYLLNTLTGDRHILKEGDVVTLVFEGIEFEEGTEIMIVHQLKDGTLEYIDATLKDGVITFIATSFSYYGIITKDSYDGDVPSQEVPSTPSEPQVSGPESKPSTDLPLTGVSQSRTPAYLIGLGAVMMMTSYKPTKRKRKKV
ncbi:hypothetical protein AOC36_08600 [Erysipelothrix larvae]|uniref:BIG2 domain-containing protein n=1 Tax=Erysipelothrix larvae TaxID=1514105 RepID=A0A0X8H0V8_9FIRM|nr:MBG domain-containing protein [Erysipelothrix larvae]AMC94044.1 hypothetical protein AOC36_08600 [Erysipelothrix larvae]